MNIAKQKTLIFITIIVLLLVATPSNNAIQDSSLNFFSNPPTKELHLLRVEHYLELEAEKNTQEFTVQYVFPPDYNYQVPIAMDLLNETTAEVISYQIEPHGITPNRVINFTIGSMQKEQHSMLHFSIWVLVENHDFSDAPKDIKIPQKSTENPLETRQWLSRSEMVQIHRLRIKYYANRLQGENDDILSYAKNVSIFIKEHRYAFFLLQYYTKTFFKQDAMTTLLINGENVGRSHLACALLRTKNIPARVVLAHNDQGFWTQMHYLVEYYIPSYGWVLLDSTNGKTPYPTFHQIINRLCSIEDEENTKQDYITRFMKGEERWIWINNEHVKPYYVDCKQGSKSQMFQENILSVQPFAADYAFFRTQNVFNQYEKYLGSPLSTDNELHLQQAIQFQLQACNTLADTGNINDYVFYIEKAYDEYKSIE